jgi:hypothetical protein
MRVQNFLKDEESCQSRLFSYTPAACARVHIWPGSTVSYPCGRGNSTIDDALRRCAVC